MPDRPEVPFVRIVVLNWNADWLTTRCVRSLQRSSYPADRREIVVVDNGSIDGSLQRLRTDLDGVVFVENGANLGFAEGNDRAMRALDGGGDDGLAPCDHVALVNNDAVVEPAWLEPLVAVLDDHRDVGAVAPKMLLEASFSPVTVDGPGTIAAILVDGVDVTRRCVFEQTTARPHPTRPLIVTHTVAGRATVHAPVGPDTNELTVVWDGADARDDTTLPVGPRRDRRINSLGTELTPWTEGTERWFGELDRPHLPVHETWGFSGGGVLLRGDMLRDVGGFDPAFFAYYEDTDLAWRARRRGWRTMCAPASVVHHLHGGSAGPEARGFFFLNYRNWLLTVVRNGRPGQVTIAIRTATRLSWGPFRRNVVGLARRGRRPDLALSKAWARVALGVASSVAPVVAARLRRRRVGSVAPTAATVRPRLMPATPSRPPRPRPGGPMVVYIDVTETLRSGWRAGIQRVVCELVRALPTADPDLQLVPITWSKVHGRFRRIDAAEYESLLAPTATQQPAAAPPPPSTARRRLAAAMHRTGTAPLVHRYRHRKELASVPQHHRDLLLERLEPGSVFLDVDASWNPTTLERTRLLPALRRDGVTTAMFLHDLLPQTHPQWFIPQLAEVSTAHLNAHLAAGSVVLCNSAHTRDTLVGYARSLGRDLPVTTVVPMGSSHLPAPTGGRAPATATGDAADFLIVGTVEPRKNHTVVLDAFAKLHAGHPTARLVVVGRPGWHSEAVAERLRSADGVEWRTDTGDDELDELYGRARAVVVASISEGFGLPVIEALSRGVPVLSSDGGALPEAGGDAVELFDPYDVDRLHQLMESALDPDHHRRQVERAGGFRPIPWRTTAARVAEELRAARTAPVA